MDDNNNSLEYKNPNEMFDDFVKWIIILQRSCGNKKHS